MMFGLRTFYFSFFFPSQLLKLLIIYIYSKVFNITISFNSFSNGQFLRVFIHQISYLQAFNKSSGEISSNPLALFTRHHTSERDIMPPQSCNKLSIVNEEVTYKKFQCYQFFFLVRGGGRQVAQK